MPLRISRQARLLSLPWPEKLNLQPVLHDYSDVLPSFDILTYMRQMNRIKNYGAYVKEIFGAGIWENINDLRMFQNKDGDFYLQSITKSFKFNTN